MWSVLISTVLLCNTTVQNNKSQPNQSHCWLLMLPRCCFSPNRCYKQGCRGWNQYGHPVLLLNHLLKHQILCPGGRLPSDYLCKSIKPQSNWLDTSPQFQDLVFLEAGKVGMFALTSIWIHLLLLKEVQLTWVELEEGLDLCFRGSLWVNKWSVWH